MQFVTIAFSVLLPTLISLLCWRPPTAAERAAQQAAPLRPAVLKLAAADACLHKAMAVGILRPAQALLTGWGCVTLTWWLCRMLAGLL